MFKIKSIPVTDQYLCLGQCLSKGKQIASFSMCVQSFQVLGRRGICLVAGIFGGRRNSVSSSAIAILSVQAERPLIHFEICGTDLFRIFNKLLSLAIGYQLYVDCFSVVCE